MFGNVSTLVGETDKDTTEEQIIAFNKEYEAFNKKIMYGADVITVFNKAMDNNKTYNATPSNDDKEYYIDVVIHFRTDFGTRIERYTRREATASNRNRYEKNITKEDIVFRANNSYTLQRDREKIKSLLIDALSWYDEDEDITYNNQESSVTEGYSPGCQTYTVTYYPAAEFKRTMFYCSNVEYSPTSGRVIRMEFTQKV